MENTLKINLAREELDQEKKSLAELIADRRNISVEEAQYELDQLKGSMTKVKKGTGTLFTELTTAMTILQAVVSPVATGILGGMGLTAHRIADSLNSESTHPSIWKKLKKNDQRIKDLEDRIRILESK